MAVIKEVMAEKRKAGWALPVPILEAIEQAFKRMKSKEQYLVVCAAFLRFVEASEDEQNEAISRVKMAELPGGSFDRLLAKRPIKSDGVAFDDLAEDENGETLPPAGATGRGPGGRKKPKR
jgi:hypothetical protein